MRILFVGDVVGKPGRNAALGLIPALRKKQQVDVVVVNCENASGGKGISPDVADSLLRGGADVLTGGNHVWQFRDIAEYIESEPRLVRPANYPNAPGRGSYVHVLPDGRTLGVIQIEGRIFMRPLDCPFVAVERELGEVGRVTATLLDLHCEATSEKQAIAWHFDGKVSAAIGSHTHVQTADERILPHGTAFLTDAGMTGPHDSVIGLKPEAAIQRFLTQRFVRYEVASKNVLLCGALIDVDDTTGKAVSIERVREVWR